MQVKRAGGFIELRFTAVETKHKNFDECREYIKGHFVDWSYHDDIKTWVIDDSDMNLLKLQTILRHYFG